MRIKLNIPNNREQTFLDYFNAELRSKYDGYTASAGFLKDSSFESQITGDFSINDKQKVILTWLLHRNPDGSIHYVDVQCADDSIKNSLWEPAANELITSVLCSALSERTQSFFRRHSYYYIGAQLDGEYWLPGFRFAPLYPEDPKPNLINAERIVSIDMNFKAIDKMHAYCIAEEKAKRYSARLSLLMNVGLYKSPDEHRWVVKNGNSQRCHLGFFKPNKKLDSMPGKKMLCQLGKYKAKLDSTYLTTDLLSLPPEARKILRGIESVNPIIAEAFDRCARLYQVALVAGRAFPSVRLAYQIASIDAISQCLKGYKGFSDFVRQHVKERPGLNEMLDLLYSSVRSAHFHGGKFPMGEYSIQSVFDPIMSTEIVQLSNLQRFSFDLIREAIINWLIEIIPEIKE